LTSRNEGTPLTLIEAMANARPVVATAVGGVVDLLGGIPDVDLRRQHDWQICERGVQVQPGDEAAFSHALAYLIDHPELREQMGARGLQFVERHYSKERLVADLKQIYEELLAPEQADDVARQLAPRTTSETQGRGEAHTS